jgi:hypothetical protein
MTKQSESRPLTTTVAVMRALGGIQAVSALTGSGYKATENWNRFETFPPRYFLVMTWALHKKGLSAPPELWGMVTPAERRKAIEAVIGATREQAA